MAKRIVFLFACACAAACLAAMPAGYSLPAGFVDARWIEGTADGKQWILTDFRPECTDTVEMRVRFKNLSATQTMFCSRTKIDENSFVSFFTGGKIRVDRATNKQATNFTIDDKTQYDFVFDFKNLIVTCNGTENILSNLSAADFTPGSVMTLFASHQAGDSLTVNSWVSNYAEYRLFHFAVKSETGEYKIALAPAKETATDKVGLYDVIGGKFYPNISQTPFVNGADTPDVIWSEESDALVLTVPVLYTFTQDDASRIVSSGKDIVFRGPGLIEIDVELNGFDGDITIESGTVSIRKPKALGTNTEKRCLRILDGACLALDATVSRLLENKIVEFAGEGPDGAGALQFRADKWNAIEGCEFHLTGDAKVNLARRIDFRESIDTHGFMLDIKSNSSTSFVTPHLRNTSDTPSIVVNSGGKTTMQHGANTFEGSSGNVYRMMNGSYWSAMDSMNDGGWTLEFCDGAYIEVDKNIWTADGWSWLKKPVLRLPLDFSGNTRVTVNTNTTVTFECPFSGSGKITIDGGWLNLNTENITYSGAIAAVAKQNQTPPWRAGLGLHKDVEVPASEFSLNNADLRLNWQYTFALPKLVFSGGTCKVSGGHMPVETRIPCAGIVISNNAEAVIDTSLSVTGAVEALSGVLRIPERLTAKGNPGLMSYTAYPEKMAWGFSKPTPEEIERDYTTRCPFGFDTATAKPVTEAIANYRFHGYMWNRTGEPANWTFYANFDDRTFMWFDGKLIIDNFAGYGGVTADKRIKTVQNVAPGHHEIIIIFTKDTGSTRGPADFANYGPCPIAYDKLGRGMTEDLHLYYEPLRDEGDGSVFTIDAELQENDPIFVPVFSNLTMTAQSTLDAGGHAVTVGTFKGAPSLVNLPELAVSEGIVLSAENLLSGEKLVFDGTIAFAEGATIDVDCEDIRAISHQDRVRLSKGVTAVQANEITGNPQISASAKAGLFSARKIGNTIKLWYNARHLIIIR